MAHLRQGTGKKSAPTDPCDNYNWPSPKLMADELLQQGNPEQAVKLYNELLGQYPECSQIYERLGDCCMAMRNYEQARACYLSAMQLQPSSVHAAAALSKIHIIHDETDDAQEVLRLSLVSNPDVPELHMALGIIQKELGNYDHAIGHFQKVMMADEDNMEALYELGECCFIIGLNKQAEPFFVRAMNRDKSFLKPLECLGKIYFADKKYAMAAVVLQKWLDVMRPEMELHPKEYALNVPAKKLLSSLASSYHKTKCYQNENQIIEFMQKMGLE